MTQFKDKSRPGGLRLGRAVHLSRPCRPPTSLLYDTDRVPVGEDQRQHIELARDVAERFNSRYGETFVDPRRRRAPRRRPGDGPPGADQQDVEVRRLPRRHGVADRGPRLGRQEVQAGGHRLRRRGPLRLRRPSPGCRTCCRSSGRSPDARPRRSPTSTPSTARSSPTPADAVVAVLEPIQARLAELRSDPAETTRLLADRSRQGPWRRRGGPRPGGGPTSGCSRALTPAASPVGDSEPAVVGRRQEPTVGQRDRPLAPRARGAPGPTPPPAVGARLGQEPGARPRGSAAYRRTRLHQPSPVAPPTGAGPTADDRAEERSQHPAEHARDGSVALPTSWVSAGDDHPAVGLGHAARRRPGAALDRRGPRRREWRRSIAAIALEQAHLSAD